MKTFTVTLSQAQGELFREQLRQSEKMGDCSITWTRTLRPSITFQDYEGVQGFLALLRARRPALHFNQHHTRSFDAALRKIDAGVRKACQ